MASCCRTRALGCAGLRSCSAWGGEHRLSSYGPWTDLPRGVWSLSSWTWGWTPVPYAGRLTLNHWATREVHHLTHFPFLIKYPVACTYCILFIHPSIDRQLGCFYLLAVVHGADINMDVQIFFKTLLLILLDVYLETKCISGSHGNSVWIFEDLPYCFRQQLHHFTNPIDSIQGFQLLGIPSNTGYFLVFFFLSLLLLSAAILMGVRIRLSFNRIF